MSSGPPSVSTSRIFAVPQLDEDSLRSGAKSGDNSRSAPQSHQQQQLQGHGRIGVNGSTTRSPVKSSGTASGFTLVADGVPGFGVIAHEGGTPPSPSTLDVTDAAFLQQQQAAAVASAAAALEQEYYHAQILMQQSPRPVLLAVLQSLMDDYPTTLIAPVKARLEHFFNANAMLKSSMLAMSAGGAGTLSGTPSPNAAMARYSGGSSGRRTSAASFVPNTNAAPWTPSSQAGGAGVSSAATPYSHTHSPAHSRGATSTKSKGKSAKEEQEMCSIHHSMRAMKHLQLNTTTGKYECILGFHCLVDEPMPAKKEGGVGAAGKPRSGGSPGTNTTPADKPTSPSSGFTVLAGNTVGGGAAMNESSVHELGEGAFGGRGGGGAGAGLGPSASSAAVRFVDPSPAGGFSSGLQNSIPSTLLQPRGSGSSGRGDGSSPADDELLAYTLKLLQSVRDIEEEEEE